MKMKKNIADAFNKQINEELYSAYLYLSMAAHFHGQTLNGIGTWLEIQAKEELGHAMKFFKYLDERNARVELKPIKGPKTVWSTVLEAFEDVQSHEKHITTSIHELMKLSISESDYASQAFLTWFVTEQVEEESHANTIVEKLKMIGDSKNGLLMLDKELRKRAE
jgi:ferritin